jgi:hypothetical protein
LSTDLLPTTNAFPVSLAIDYGEQETRLISRAEAVLTRIGQIKGDLVRRALELGALLLEAREHDYHVVWGFPRFGDWVEASDLDMSERQAYYLMQIVQRAQALNITQAQLERVKLTKLKEIFALKAAPDDVIKQLVENAETATLEEVKYQVQVVKQGGEDNEFTFINLDLKGKRIPRLARDRIMEAFEDIRRRYGNTVNGEGEVCDITDWRALEMICEEYLNDPNRHEQVLEAEFAELPQETPLDYHNG